MKNDDFNVWKDLFGYSDMDYDGDVDWIDAELEEEMYEVEKKINDSSSFYSEYDDLDDFDDDF